MDTERIVGINLKAASDTHAFCSFCLHSLRLLCKTVCVRHQVVRFVYCVPSIDWLKRNQPPVDFSFSFQLAREEDVESDWSSVLHQRTYVRWLHYVLYLI